MNKNRYVITNNIVKKIIAFLMIFICLSTCVLTSTVNVKAANRSQHSAYLLEGKTIIITVFVKDGRKKVSNEQKKNDLLITQAEAEFGMDIAYDCGKESNIITGDYSKNKDLVYEVTCKNPQNIGAQKSYAVGEKFKDDLYSAINKKVPLNKLLKKYKTNSYIYRIVLPKMEFRAFMTTLGENRYDETIFTVTESDAQCVAHEMLHCFGAIDLYYQESDGICKAQKKLAQKIKKEYKGTKVIMQGGEWSSDKCLVRATISDINMYFLGLKGNKKKLQKKYPMVKFSDKPGVGGEIKSLLK